MPTRESWFRSRHFERMRCTSADRNQRCTRRTGHTGLHHNKGHHWRDR